MVLLNALKCYLFKYYMEKNNMRTSYYLLSTIKENPKDTEIISHKLMLRAGIIRQVSVGLYVLLPTGLRILQKMKNIIREEMNKINSIEILMPVIQPISLWKNSGRLFKYGSELIKFKDRKSRSYIISPTNEEMITDLIKNELNSYKQLPLILYQIQTKFRDEIRPRFGVIRSREFIMKDAYSFHSDKISLQKTYIIIQKIYKNIFKRIDLKYYMVEANTGSIGGVKSHEFHVLSNNGESSLVFSTKSKYISNIELAKTSIPKFSNPMSYKKLKLINIKNIEKFKDVILKYSIPIKQTLKIYIVYVNPNIKYKFIALIIRGDHKLNKSKVEKLLKLSSPLLFVNEKNINLYLGVKSFFLGPIHLTIPMIIDYNVFNMSNFISGANINGKFFLNINWLRDIPMPKLADLRKIVKGDISPDNQGYLKIKKSIEIAHIFQLGKKYSRIFKTSFKNKNSKNITLTMGCYGIGLLRTIASVIEQNNDKNGIIWPEALAPFNIAILPINMYKSNKIYETSNDIYNKLKEKKLDVLFDDRKEQFGLMLSDIELIGIPNIIIISKRSLNQKSVEYKNRKNGKKILISLNEIINFIIKKIN